MANGRVFHLLSVLLLLGACQRSAPEPARSGRFASLRSLVDQSTSEVVAVASRSGYRAEWSTIDSGGDPPLGYVAMRPEIAPALSGAVLLIDQTGETLVPIFIGGTEALSIKLRLQGQRFARPLTHDLMDEALKRLGSALIRVQVDELRGDTFIGSVFIRRDGQVLKLDSRPSDAIALAVGNDVPIYVSQDLIARAGIPVGELEDRAIGDQGEPLAL